MDPVQILAKRVESSTLAVVADELGISITYLHGIINGRQAPGPKVLEAMGLTRKTVYEKAKR